MLRGGVSGDGGGRAVQQGVVLEHGVTEETHGALVLCRTFVLLLYKGFIAVGDIEGGDEGS